MTKGLINREQIFDITMKWLDRCAQIRALEPPRSEFVYRVRKRIDRVMCENIMTIRYDNLKGKCPELYKKLEKLNASQLVSCSVR